METVRYPIKSLLGVGAAALLSLYGAFAFYGEQSTRNQVSADKYMIGIQEMRFETMKRELPRVPRLGYISDITTQPAVFLSAQYALAPALLVDSPREEWLVGNFSKPMDYAEFGRARKLVLVKDYSNGVVLYRRAVP
ncbi:MAG TPA: hypothetical protein VJN43_23015 [Bryobacteraceae bacterium]|nr:hypothetical protein [Bryobacteraceae bacterium]